MNLHSTKPLYYSISKRTLFITNQILLVTRFSRQMGAKKKKNIEFHGEFNTIQVVEILENNRAINRMRK